MSGGSSGLRYKRLLLKLSGEALVGKAGYGIDVDVVMRLCREMKEAVDAGASVGVVGGVAA
ncbi:MAG: UMP kinase, partial [Brachymonas sp.]|nr:UMP kinase [Brachymonas sp.]